VTKEIQELKAITTETTEETGGETAMQSDSEESIIAGLMD